MKKLILLLLSFTVITSLTSCDVEDKINEVLEDLVQFDLDANTNIDISIAPAGTITTEGDATTNIEEELEDNNFNQDNIGAIRFKELRLTIPESASVDFSIVESISIKIGAEGLESVDVASISSVANNTRMLDLTAELSNDDFVQFLLKDTITYEITITTNEAITQAFTLDIASLFTVSPKVDF